MQGYDMGMYNPMPYPAIHSPHPLSPKVHAPYPLDHFGQHESSNRSPPMSYSGIGVIKQEEHQHSPNPQQQQRQPQPHHIPMPSPSQMINPITMKHEEQDGSLSPLRPMESMQQHMQSITPMQQQQQQMQPPPQSMGGPMSLPQLPSRESMHHPIDIQPPPPPPPPPSSSQQQMGSGVGTAEIERQEFTYMPIPTNAGDRDPENFHFQNDPFSTGIHD